MLVIRGKAELHVNRRGGGDNGGVSDWSKAELDVNT